MILCQKSDNFLSFFVISIFSISTFHEIKAKTYIKIVRHASLH